MKLKVSYEFPNQKWTVSSIYSLVGNYIKNTYPNTVVVNSTTVRMTKDPCNIHGPGFLVITNMDTKKYLVVSYWDRAYELFFRDCGWEPEYCMGILTSHGVIHNTYELSKQYNVPIIPISFSQYLIQFDKLALKSIPLHRKSRTELLFRGFLHGDGYRDKLGELLPETVLNSENKLEPLDYYKELQDTRICLSLNGAAELSHRDIEILGAGSVLLRPILKQKFHNRLLNNVHYIGYEYGNSAKEHADNLLKKYKEIKNNDQLLKTVSENGYKWFLNNGTVQKNAEIIISQLDLNTLL